MPIHSCSVISTDTYAPFSTLVRYTLSICNAEYISSFQVCTSQLSFSFLAQATEETHLRGESMSTVILRFLARVILPDALTISSS
jgi:hypothetical protein